MHCGPLLFQLPQIMGRLRLRRAVNRMIFEMIFLLIFPTQDATQPLIEALCVGIVFFHRKLEGDPLLISLLHELLEQGAADALVLIGG